MKSIKNFFKKIYHYYKKNKLKFFLYLSAFGFASLLLMFLLIMIIFGSNLPDYKKLSEYRPSVTTRFYADDGSLLVEYALEKRIYVDINEVPKSLIDAFVAAEDKNFWSHSGIDYIGILRAVFVNIKSKLTGGGRMIGASTITQQVAKNFFLSPERTIVRKIKEAILATRMEGDFSKEHILTLYLNQIYLGMRSYGVAAAAQNYFNKSLKELTLGEAAFLAGLPKAPNNYNPARFPERAKIRRDYVLGRMLEDKHITEDEYNKAKEENIVVSEYFLNNQKNYSEYFAEEVRQKIIDQYGNDAIYSGGLFVRTSADPKYQKWATDALKKGILNYDKSKGWRGPAGKIKINKDGSAEIIQQYEEDDSAKVEDFNTDEVNDNSKKTKNLTFDSWKAALKVIELSPGALSTWKKAFVLKVDSDNAVIGLLDKDKTINGNIPLSEMKWARENLPKKQLLGAKITSANQVLNVGDVVFVENLGGNNYALKQIPDLDGGIVAIDPHTGRILALVGGFSFDKSKFNRVTQGFRQPGSTIKPFIYLTALEKGYTPSSVIMDAPVVMEQADGEVWKPDNYDNVWKGPVTLRRALEKSRNNPAIRTAQNVGIYNVINTAKKFGVYNDNLEELNLSLALGSGATNLLRMTTAFAQIVNGGKQIKPTFVDRIQNRDGDTVFARDERECTGCRVLNWEDGLMPPVLPDNRKRLASSMSTFQISTILEGVVKRGTGRRAKVWGKTIGGKTGTSNEYKDAWFVGFSPDLAVGVYLGFDTPRTLGSSGAGGAVAAPIFQDFMSKALADKPDQSFRSPDGINFVRVNLETGLPANFSDDENNVILEAFKPGYEDKLKENEETFSDYYNKNNDDYKNTDNYDEPSSDDADVGGFY